MIDRTLIATISRAVVGIMQSIRLSVARAPLLDALKTLSVTRRRRFSSSLPIWLKFATESGELQVVEEQGQVAARVPANGTWPPLGATVDLFMLKRGVARLETDSVDLHALCSAIVIFGDRWQIRLNLLPFGPESRRPKMPTAEPQKQGAPLPLFEWASRKGI